MSAKKFKKLSCVKLTCDFRAATVVVEVPLDPPGAGVVLVKNLYAGVNASDINITAGRYFTDGKTPFDFGFEGLGLIEALGDGVTDFSVGQAVLYFGRNGFSEYFYTPVEVLVPIPEVKPEYIAILACGLTAAVGLDVGGRIKSGDKVLITAAAGGTGHICVQWAKAKGCHVIGITSSPEKAVLLKKLGCDRIINYKAEPLDEALKKHYPEGVDVIWETIGGEVFEMLINHLAVKGRMVVIGGISGYKTVGFPSVNLRRLPSDLIMKSRSLNGFLLTDYMDMVPTYLPKLIGMVTEGKLSITCDLGDSSADGPFNGVKDVVRGVEHLHAGKNLGKVVVKIQ